MKLPNLSNSTGMLIDGIFASEAIDSSGEILDVKGADISDFEEGKGVLNYEHRGDDAPGASPNDVVGRIVYATKIYKETDCANERQRKYWKQIELPFIYGIIRLHDGAGHPGSIAAAAHFRDYAANKEDALGRFSIEGSTLSRGDGSESNRLLSTVCRRVAYTFKPCNKSADSGMIIDPNAPEGFEHEPNAKPKDKLANLAEISKKEKGGRVIGMGPTFTHYEPLDKATTAGSYNAAPSSLQGGSALQIEDAGLRRKLHVNCAKAAVRDWDKKEPLRPFLKNRLPDADPDFLQRFADDVENIKLKKKEQEDPNRPLSIRGKPVKSTPTVDKPHFDEKAGVLRTPRGSVPMYIPSRDPAPGAAQAFHNSLNDPAATKVHDYAIKNWSRVHNLLKTGKLPDAVLMHATLFSQLSPNTPVPTQELMYGHLVDAMKQTGIDARDPRFATIKDNWIGRDNPSEWPTTGGNHYDRIAGQLRIKHDSKLTGRKAGEIGGFMLANNKMENMAEYHKLHGKLADLLKKHGTNTQTFVNELMQHKTKGELWNAQRERNKDKGKPDIGEYAGPVVRGLAPKTARYMHGMLGGGNSVVPDTHFIRHLFGLEKGTGHTQGHLDNHTIDYLKTLLWNPNNSHVMEGIDRYYNQHHDAVNHLASNPAVAGIDRKDINFPAFWKHWMAIVPHEAARGMGTGGFNEFTDHKPFWDTVGSYIDKQKGLVKHEDQEAFTKAQNSVKEHMHWHETLGEFPAMMLYYAYLIPDLIGQPEDEVAPKEGLDLTDTPNGAVDPVVKFEKWSIDLRITVADLLKVEADQAPVKPRINQAVDFQGQKILPGHLRAPIPGSPGEFADHSVLGHDDKHFFTVPVHPGRLGNFEHSDIQKFNKQGQGSSYQILKWPMPMDKGGSNVVDSAKHGDPLFNQSAVQNKLIHGLDMSEGEFQNLEAAPGATDNLNHWREHPNGQKVYVKKEGEGEIAGDACGVYGKPNDEAAYHNLARDVFGLGDYVPPVAVFNHPKTGRRMSAIAKVDGGEHHRNKNLAHQDIINSMAASGDLHKIGMMDWVLGHDDRHSGNYLLTPHGKAPMQLIDNSNILPAQGYKANVIPEYLTKDNTIDHLNAPIGDNAQDWAMRLDPDVLGDSLTSMKYPPYTVRAAKQRLAFLKNTIDHQRTVGKHLTAADIFEPPEEENKGEW